MTIKVPRARRRAEGIYYTPPDLVAEVVRETLSVVLARAAWRNDGTPMIRVLDPACGDGRFLVAAVEHLAQASAARGRAASPRAIAAQCVTGVERDPEAAAVARAALGGAADIRCADALAAGTLENGIWDAILGNPPYVRSVRLRAADPVAWQRLRGAYAATSYKEWDLYAAFLEQALAWATPETGEIGLVLPSRWLTAEFAAPLRAKLARERALRKIVDFGARQLFAGATTYIALIYLTRAGAGSIEVTKDERRVHVASASLDGGPWTFSANVARLRRAGPALGEVARISKGAGTNADPVFLLEPRGGRTFSHALGEEVDLELDSVMPCLRGRDITPYAQTIRRVALRDRLELGGRALPFGDYAKTWPRAAAYLARCRAILEARESGRFRGEAFHCWGRPQNLAWLADRTAKIVVPDATARGRAALDDRGAMIIDTAYAIRPLDPGRISVGLLLAILNSPIVAIWLGATGIPLRGGYFRMKTAYLASLPVLDPAHPDARGIAETALALAPDDTAGQAALDARVVQAYA